MSAFSTISALRRRRPEGLPEGNAAAGGGSQGGACRGRLAGSALLGVPRRGRLAGDASQGAPRRGRWRTATPSEGCSRFWLSAPTRSGPLRPAPARPVRPPGDFPASPPLRAPLRFGLLLRRRSVPSLRPACTSEMPRRLRTPATTQPHNPATTQPRNHAATQPPQPLSHAKRALPSWGEPFCIGMASCAYPRNESRIPAATAEPTTPATLGPMACISR